VVTILQFGHIEEVAVTPVSLKFSVVLSSAVSTMVQVRINPNALGAESQIPCFQLFFADRVRRFSGNWYIFIFLGVLSLWRLGVGIWATVGAMETANIIIFGRKYRWSMMFYALGSTIDLTIAISLCYFLLKHRKTSIKK
jgi:hypothetical protein